MSRAATLHRMSAEEFLAWDERETIRHEFVRGALFSVAGEDEGHNTVIGNLCIALRVHLRDTACRTLAIDMKLRVEAADCFFYPDVVVTCSANDAADLKIKREPCLVVEVLSASTAGYDRGDKFAAYRLLPTLQEYLLVDPESRRCDLYRKGDDGLWVLHPVEPGQDLHLASVGLALPATALWAEMPQPAAAATAREAARRQSSPL